MPILEIKNLSKNFGDITVLNNVSLDVEKGDIYGILGLSGAGKSTLVRCINGLEKANSGELYFNGELVKDFNRMYRRKVAMIFQGFNLLQQRSVLANVSLAGEIIKDKHAKEKAKKLLEQVGLGDKLDAYPSTLSGGQQQRVAIARALMTDPEILLCDEATSALDPETTDSILALLSRLNKELGLTIIMISHQMGVIESICNKVAVISKAEIVEKGLLRDVFLNPQSDVAKKLIYAGHYSTELSDDSFIRIIFNGDVDEPLISNIVQDCNIQISIYFADTKTIEGRIYGQIILRLPTEKESADKLRQYLTIKNVKFQEVSKHELN